jgi:hypothetical protein
MSSAKQKKELQDQVKYDNYINTAFKNAIIVKQAPIKQDIVISENEPLKNQIEITKNNLSTITNDPVPIINYLKSDERKITYFNKYFNVFVKTLPGNKITSFGQFQKTFDDFLANDLGEKINTQSIVDNKTILVFNTEEDAYDYFENLTQSELNSAFRNMFEKENKRKIQEGDTIIYPTAEGKMSAQTKVTNVMTSVNVGSINNEQKNNNRKIRYILKVHYGKESLPRNKKRPISWKGGDKKNKASEPSTSGSGLRSSEGFPNRKVLKKKSVLFR